MPCLTNKVYVYQRNNPGKSGKPKMKGVSMTEFLTPEQVRAHIASLRRCVDQGKPKTEAVEHSMPEKSCQLCAAEKLTFEPTPIYCSGHGLRIHHNAMYYTFVAGSNTDYLCVPCYDKALGDTVMLEGAAVPKARLEKKKNDHRAEELWVQCDKCKAWQHQICALFNGCPSEGGQAEYTCPFCYIQEIDKGERAPLPQTALLGAKDLPRTMLSDHLEHRLFTSLKHERQERARVQGMCYDEIPGVEEIVVRVVSSVDEKLEVNPLFHELFQEDNYPTQLLYKSKAILLFQKIDGVDVCLFCMYVQEFGSECQPPNQRRVNLSCFDSVKYFRPEVKAVTGEALRTFVYHEILIGYLEYCKKRGFTSCYIWVCPPLKGEDHILYCHPEMQKAPTSDKPRDWHLAMLNKASEENIVVELTNLYDHFFASTGECKAKVTAARLPYFDGDYWPGAVKEIIQQLNQEEDGRKGTTNKAFTDLSSNASKDLLFMHRLGDKLMAVKEDFIIVHLQHSCSHCCTLMVSGKRWVCNQCKKFQICNECYEAEEKLAEEERHPTGNKEMHTLFPTEITGVPDDTKDEDEILEGKSFDSRQGFLNLCHLNHNQFDTLRRAKHSSIMLVYHLHHSTCELCDIDIGIGQRLRSEAFPDHEACNACSQKVGGVDPVTNHPPLPDRDAQIKEAWLRRGVELRKMLDALAHSAQCRKPLCNYPNCRKMKHLFRHGIQCKLRGQGCLACNKLWYLFQRHARRCQDPECNAPRCRDFRYRLQRHSDFFWWAAVMEMMRLRPAHFASNSA